MVIWIRRFACTPRQGGLAHTGAARQKTQRSGTQELPPSLEGGAHHRRYERWAADRSGTHHRGASATVAGSARDCSNAGVTLDNGKQLSFDLFGDNLTSDPGFSGDLPPARQPRRGVAEGRTISPGAPLSITYARAVFRAVKLDGACLWGR